VATETVRYLTYHEVVLIHFTLMRYLGESRFGIFSRDLVESALARPHHAAVYENADIVRQAAHLCYGFIKDHPWVGGNKRTATMLMREFLRLNGYKFNAPSKDIVDMVLAVESDQWMVAEIESWLRRFVSRPSA